jgi:hypothetical protein
MEDLQMSGYKIIQTDNFGRDYPGETFVNVGPVTEEHAKNIAKAINDACSGNNAPRYWMVVPADYELQGGFEP